MIKLRRNHMKKPAEEFRFARPAAWTPRPRPHDFSLGEINLEGIQWVIVGGESGAGARPMQKEWVLSIRDQCDRAQVPFFFKQWGGVRKSKAGRELDGKTYDAMPGRVELPVLARPNRLNAVAEIEQPYKSATMTCEPSFFPEQDSAIR
jgi:hypothetical protein